MLYASALSAGRGSPFQIFIFFIFQLLIKRRTMRPNGWPVSAGRIKAILNRVTDISLEDRKVGFTQMQAWHLPAC